MHIIDNQLQHRESTGKLIRVGLIGFGEMSKGLFNQITRHTPGMKVVTVFARNFQKAVKSFEELKFDNYRCTNSETIYKAAIEKEEVAVSTEIDLILDSEHVDVVVELTGSIKFGLTAIKKAFEKKIDVVSFNAELESTFGPYIYSLANKHEVKYTLGDGDQPGVTLNLFRHVKSMGFKPLVLGNIKGMQDHYRTPKTQMQFAKSWGMSPLMATNFVDGTKISFEQAAIGNAVGVGVAKRGMIGPKTTEHVDTQTHRYNIEMLYEKNGIVDYLLGAKPSPGVFVYAASEDPLSTKYLEYGKLGNGPLYSFYVPYHLLFFELAFSIARLIDFNDTTLVSENGMVIEVVAVSKQDLHSGIKLDGIGGFHAFGQCENSFQARNENLLPMGLSEYCVLKEKAKKNQPITLDMVEIIDDQLFKAYFEQFEEEKHFTISKDSFYLSKVG